MKNQIATTTEQSQRLIACGVNPESADMVWTTWDNDGERLTQLSVMSEFAYEVSCLNPIPVWSLSALLALLPIEINDKGLQSKMQLEPLLNEDEEDAPRWAVSYYDYYTNANLCFNESSDPIEVCVKAIEWLTKNGYKLNKP